MQANPDSSRHMLEHPSRETVFPSSHSSSYAIILSPQTDLQVEGDKAFPPEHIKPGSGPVQSDLQLIVSVELPSSHISAPTFLPSPQTVAQVFGTAPVHTHPSSTKQALLHPSPLTIFPSSHDSD